MYNVEEMLSDQTPASYSDDMTSAIVPYVRDLFPGGFDEALGKYLKTIPLDVLSSSYYTISGDLSSDASLSGYVGGKIPLSVAEAMFSLRNTEIKQFDDSLTSMVRMYGSTPVSFLGRGSSLMTFDRFDDLAVGHQKPKPGHVIVVDITRQRYQKDDLGNEYLGIVPVFTTASNALYYQNFLVSGSKTRGEYTIIGDL